MSITLPVSLSPFDVIQTYVPTTLTDVPAQPGAVAFTPDGRRFKMANLQAGKTALSPNKLTQQPATTANMQAVTLSAQSIGDTSITITCSAQTLAANQLAGAFLGVISGTGTNQVLQIKSNPAGTSATSYLLQLVDPVYIATASSPVANIWVAEYLNNIICPTTLTGSVTGIPMVTMTPDATYGVYGWIQTNGVALALIDDAATQGLSLSPDGDLAGALSTTADTPQVAMACQTGIDAAYSFVDLML